MTVKELRKKLFELDDDLEVFVFADHGQQPYPVSSANVEHCIAPDEYGATDLVHPEDLGSYDENLVSQICLISD